MPSNDRIREKESASQSSISALLRKRRQIYSFKAEAISEKVLMTVLEDAMHVPSAGFTQDFDFIVVKDAVTRKQLAEAAREIRVPEARIVKIRFHLDCSCSRGPMCKQEKIRGQIRNNGR